MKKLLISSILVILFVSVTASARARSSVQTPSKFLSETQIENFLKTTLPQNIVEQKIVFAVNQGFAKRYPSWQQGAKEVINFINTVLAKNTWKRLTIERFMTYPDAAPGSKPRDTIDKIIKNPKYHFLNRTDESAFGGMTIFYYVAPNLGILGTSGALDRLRGKPYGKGKNYGTVVIFENEQYSTLKLDDTSPLDSNDPLYVKKFLFQENSKVNRQRAMRVVLHEVGHALGLAHPDWYEFSFDDGSSEPPLMDFSQYEPAALYPTDPMTFGDALTPENAEFSNLNAQMLNRNAFLKLSIGEIFQLLARNVVVRVKNEKGKTVAGARVKVFGVDYEIKNAAPEKKRSKKYFPLRQTLRTDSEGKVKIKPPLGDLDMKKGRRFFAEIIKVAKDGKVGGAYLDTIMLQKARILDELDTFVLDVVIR
ncbi:hypothetical protein HYW83_00265 [Candidatus Peregrinibacteria bacterium]|nr:hypothetical protein [Candidatus Peregrinibacteria bacterium]